MDIFLFVILLLTAGICAAEYFIIRRIARDWRDGSVGFFGKRYDKNQGKAAFYSHFIFTMLDAPGLLVIVIMFWFAWLNDKVNVEFAAMIFGCCIVAAGILYCLAQLILIAILIVQCLQDLHRKKWKGWSLYAELGTCIFAWLIHLGAAGFIVASAYSFMILDTDCYTPEERQQLMRDYPGEFSER